MSDSAFRANDSRRIGDATGGDDIFYLIYFSGRCEWTTEGSCEDWNVCANWKKQINNNRTLISAYNNNLLLWGYVSKQFLLNDFVIIIFDNKK